MRKYILEEKYKQDMMSSNNTTVYDTQEEANEVALNKWHNLEIGDKDFYELKTGFIDIEDDIVDINNFDGSYETDENCIAFSIEMTEPTGEEITFVEYIDTPVIERITEDINDIENDIEDINDIEENNTIK